MQQIEKEVVPSLLNLGVECSINNMRSSESRSVTVLPGTSQESHRATVLPPLTSQYPQWSRGGKLGVEVFPQPYMSDGEEIPFLRNNLLEKVNKNVDLGGSGGGREGLVVAAADPLLRIAQMEQNIRFLQDQHKLMLSSLHQEIEQLRSRNRDLQFQLVFTKGGFIQSSSSPSSPEDDSKPKIVLSPKQLNMTSLQVEILEKEIAELKAALHDAKTKNVYLAGIVEEQKKKLERMENRRLELEAVGTKIKPALSHRSDAQNQAGCSEDAVTKLEEAEKLIRRLRRENDENRRELAIIRENLSKSLGGGGGGGRQQGLGNNHRGGGGRSRNNQASQQQSQQRFPPLHTQSYWHHGQQNQHRGGMEFVSHRHCTNGGNRDKDSQIMGRTPPSLPNLRNMTPSNGGGYGNGGHRRGGTHYNGNHYYRGNKDDDGEGRKYRGGGGARNSRGESKQQ